MDDFSIAYLHPAEPEGPGSVTAAVVTRGDEDYPMIVRGDDRGDGLTWIVEFGDVADEGDYPTFAEALQVAHHRALAAAEELVRATRDGGY